MQEDDLLFASGLEALAHKHFEVFFNAFFARAIELIEGSFVSGDHFAVWCKRLQDHDLTATVSARSHGKSTLIYAFLLWKLFNIKEQAGLFPEVIYISYSDTLAGYHIQKVKRLASVMPCFQSYGNLSDAETILKMSKDGKTFSIKPAGIFSFKRGVHTIGTIVDDPLQDPQKASMDLAQVYKITKIFNEQIAQIRKVTGWTHVFGTPQDKEDLFASLKKNAKYNCGEYPAIISHKTKRVLWKEMFPFDKLLDIRDNEIGDKAFSKEYQCVPVRGVDSFFKEEVIDILTGKCYNVDWRTYETQNAVYGGMDLGKKMHPSHIALFEAVPIKVKDEDGKDTEEDSDEVVAKQILSLFLDKMDYNDQKTLVDEIIQKLSVQAFPFDNSRAEFDTFIERDELPPEMEPITMTGKLQQTIATNFDQIVTTSLKAIKEGGQAVIEFVTDQRQKNQILSVDCDLNAPSTVGGHGDAFWSVGLALRAMREGQPNIRWLGQKQGA